MVVVMRVVVVVVVVDAEMHTHTHAFHKLGTHSASRRCAASNARYTAVQYLSITHA